MKALLAFCSMLSLFSLNAQTLKIETKPDKGVYLECESIFVQLILTNTGSNTLETNQLSLKFGHLDFVLENAAGERIERRGTLFHEPSLKKLKIAPQESIIQYFNLIPAYGRGSRLPVYQTQRFLNEGRYSLQAKYETGKGTIVSERIEFTVITPVGKDREALALLREVTEMDARKDPASIEKLLSVFQKYRETVYAPVALQTIMNAYEYRLQDRQKAKEIALLLIDNYPDDLHALGAKTYIMTRTEDINQRKQFVKSLISKYPNTKIGLDAKKSEAILRERE